MKNPPKSTFLKILPFILTIIGVSCSNNKKIENLPVFIVLEKNIIVDADTSDWTQISPETVNQKTHLWVGQGMYAENWQGPNDLSFTWRAAWKGNKIYFLYVVTDDKISPFDRPNTWLNDCVEICLDPFCKKGLRKETSNGATKLNGYETHFLPMQPPHSYLQDDSSLYFVSRPQDNDFKKLWNGVIAVSYTETGYFLELAFSIPGAKLHKGMVIGLETAVCDDDGNSRKSLLTWTGIQNDYWVKMDKYGELLLK